MMVDTCKFTAEEEALLMEQIKYLQSELCSIQSSFLGIISVPVAVYGLPLYYALQQEGEASNLLFVLMPFLFSLSLFNILKYTIKMMGLDAYTRYLEDQLNRSHGKSLFKWQSHLIYANSYSLVGGVIQVPCFVALAIFLGYKFYENIGSCRLFPHCQFIFKSLLALEVVGLLYMLLMCALQYGTVRYWCGQIPMNGYPAGRVRSECPLFLLSLYEKNKDRPWVQKLSGFVEKVFGREKPQS